MTEGAYIPTYSYTQLMSQINNEARACATNRKSGMKNLFTRIDALEADCKNGLVNGKYAEALAAAAYWENAERDSLNRNVAGAMGLSMSTIIILLAAFGTLLFTIHLLKKK